MIALDNKSVDTYEKCKKRVGNAVYRLRKRDCHNRIDIKQRTEVFN